MTTIHPINWDYKNYTYSWHVNDSPTSSYNFGQAKSFCESHHGSLAMPKNFQQRTGMLEKTCGMAFWVGMRLSTFDDDRGAYKWLEGSWDDKYLAPEQRRAPEFFETEPNGDGECVVMTNNDEISFPAPPEDQILFDYDCFAKNIPFLCQYEQYSNASIAAAIKFDYNNCTDDTFTCTEQFSPVFLCRHMEQYKDGGQGSVIMLISAMLLINTLFITFGFKCCAVRKSEKVPELLAAQRAMEERTNASYHERQNLRQMQRIEIAQHPGAQTPQIVSPHGSLSYDKDYEQTTSNENQPIIADVAMVVNPPPFLAPVKKQRVNTDALTGLRGFVGERSEAKRSEAKRSEAKRSEAREPCIALHMHCIVVFLKAPSLRIALHCTCNAM